MMSLYLIIASAILLGLGHIPAWFGVLNIIFGALGLVGDIIRVVANNND